MTRRKRWLLLAIAGLLIGAAAAVYFWPEQPMGGPDRAAQLLPADTVALAWTLPISELLVMSQAIGLQSSLLTDVDDELAATLVAAGFDPFDPNDLLRQGFDLAHPVHIALLPAPASKGLLWALIPMRQDVNAVAWLDQLLARIWPNDLRASQETLRDRSVLWLKTPHDAHLFGAAMDLDEGLALLFPLTLSHDASDAVTQELRGTIERLLDPATARLSTVESYVLSVAGTAGSIAGGYLYPDGLGRMVEEAGGANPFADSLRTVEALGLLAHIDGNRATLTARAIGPVDSQHGFLRPREEPLVDLMPLPPGFGVHLAFHAKETMDAIESAIATEQWAWLEYDKGWKAAMTAAALPTETTLSDLWDGEVALFISDLTPAPERWLERGVFVVGMADLGKARQAFSTWLNWLGDGAVETISFEAAKGWRVTLNHNTLYGMAHDGRLYLSGSRNHLLRIAQGESRATNRTDRVDQMISAMHGTGGAAAYLDLAAVVGFLPDMLSSRSRRKVEPFMPLLKALDWAHYAEEAQGRISTGTLRLAFTGTSLTELTQQVLRKWLAKAVEREGRLAKTQEAVDTLERIYLGAALYYTTPRIADDGSRMPCQFPETVAETPGQNCCADHGGPDANGDGLCDANGDFWDHPVWAALRVQLTDDHHCVYAFESNGKTGWEAEFTARAHCDLDCDGIRSTFERYGKGNTATPDSCSVTGQDAIYIEQQLE